MSGPWVFAGGAGKPMPSLDIVPVFIRSHGLGDGNTDGLQYRGGIPVGATPFLAPHLTFRSRNVALETVVFSNSILGFPQIWSGSYVGMA